MDVILLDGDQALFEPSFGAATVVVRPGPVTASGPGLVKGRPMCVTGDEASVSVGGCAYITATHTIPGTGTLSVAALADAHTAQKTQTGGKPVLLVGGSFDARFLIDAPAKQPGSPPVDDPAPEYAGRGSFQSTNQKSRGT